MVQHSSLFLSQSYMDAWDDYQRALTQGNFARWDYIILTASNVSQAEKFEMQIEERKNSGFLPKQTHFAVVPDPDGKRIGSGGATLNVIRYIFDHCEKKDFSGLRILVIHSGGDSKRIPQYSALGKLFSPVPHRLPNGRASTLFDEFMLAMSGVPSRMQEGMLLLSGDVLLLFNPLQIDYSGLDAAAISFKETVEIGQNHGVFLSDNHDHLIRFLHKQPVDKLYEYGAVDERGLVDIDTGAVFFSTEMLSSLHNLIADSTNYDIYVNEKVCLSLYGDFLYPLAEKSSLDQFYLEIPENEFCEELRFARRAIWDALRKYNLKILHLAPAKFIHFGTTNEILNLMSEEIQNFSALGWTHQVNSSISGETAGYNSVLSNKSTIGKNCYLESSYIYGNTVIGDRTILSYIEISDTTIPSDVVLHGLKLKNGKYSVRIYGIKDNPKENKLFGCLLSDFAFKNGFPVTLFGSEYDKTLWKADLYPECDTIQEAVTSALNIYNMAFGTGNPEIWKTATRRSLCSGFAYADSHALLAWDNRMQELVKMECIMKMISEKESVTKAKTVLNATRLTSIQEYWLKNRLLDLNFSEKIRLYYYIGMSLNGIEGEKYIRKCFDTISQTILDNMNEDIQYNTNYRIVTDYYKVKLPLRVNFGGGWSDTPPYCLEHGGTVLNAAVLIDGNKPVEVTMERLQEQIIAFESKDMDAYKEFHEIQALQTTGNPYDPFALQKASLIACGILPREGGNLSQILKRIGGGFLMRSEVINVPKGSGLGTSSILAAGCVKAISNFFGIRYTEHDIYQRVFVIEQIMSTGGGWQDQVGGLTAGFKYITTKPGINQKIKVEHFEIPEEVVNELNERFVLIYTGQRRLARNLLRDVVGKYVGNTPETIIALNEIQKTTALMRFELDRGNIDAFATLLNDHWELSKQIDRGSTNTLIDQIFNSIDDLIAGKLVCGAGGGGFLQVILKRGVTKEDVRIRLKEVFCDSSVDIWNCTLFL